MNLIVVEGSDGSGKSTVVEAVHNALGWPVKHFKAPGTKEEAQADYESFTLSDKNNVILDRSWLGEFIYGPLIRHYIPDYLGELEENLRTREIKILYILMNPGERWSFNNLNKDDFGYDNRRLHQDISNKFIEVFNTVRYGHKIVINPQNYRSAADMSAWMVKIVTGWLNYTNFYERCEPPYALTCYNPKQRFVLGTMETDRDCSCVLPDTLMLNSNMIISDVIPGDSVIGANGSTNVNKTMVRNYNGKLLNIKATYLLPILITPEHPLFVVTGIKEIQRFRYDNPHWIKAKELIYGYKHRDYLLLPRINGDISLSNINLKKYIKINTRVKMDSISLNKNTAWLFGLYVAEGNTSPEGPWFSLNINEQKIINKICLIGKKLKLTSNVYKNKNYIAKNVVRVRVVSAILGRMLSANFGHGATEKCIPNFILLNKNKQLLQAFLNGYLTGDGHFTKRLNRYEWSTVSNILALQLQLLCARLGYPVSIYKTAPKHNIILGRKVNIHTKYRMTMSLKNRKDRVLEKFIKCPIKSIIETSYNGAVHNLETNDNTYLVQNAIVHNCGHFKDHQQYPYWKAQHSITWGQGNVKNPKFIMVGEAPGMLGCGTTGLPFYFDKSGFYLKWLLFKNGIAETQYYITNISKCCPKDNKINLEFANEDAKQHLVRELNYLESTTNHIPIIALGRTAEAWLISNWTKPKFIYHPASPLYTGKFDEYEINFNKIMKEISL